MTLIEAIQHPELFGPFFRDLGTWRSWLAVLRTIFGLPITDEHERSLFVRSTGRQEQFASPVTEGWLICGRRSGKSFIAALVAVFLATFREYSAYLSPGERGVVMVLAVDRDQARVIFNYVAAFIDDVPALAGMVVGRTAESLDLANGISIEVHTSSFRSVRGRTLVAALCDEVAFWRSDETRNPDREVLAALRPAMATIPNALLLCLSSPYARAGALYEAFDRHYGNDRSDVLVWRAPTVVMNPTIREGVIRRAFENDPQAAAAEWDAEFRSDVSAFLDEAWISAAINAGVFERPSQKSRTHTAFVDPSGGKADSFTLSIAHREEDQAVQDLVREWKPPFDPAGVVKEIAALLRAYGLRGATGDAYSGEWVQSAFRKEGVAYTVAEKSRSDIYLETGPLLAQRRVHLLDNGRQTAQLRQLERRVSPGGRDRVNHPPGGHDDLANAGMGAIWLCLKRSEVAQQSPVVHNPHTWDPMQPDTWRSGGGPRSKVYQPTKQERAKALAARLIVLTVELGAIRRKVEAGEINARSVVRKEREIEATRRRLEQLEKAA